jgi:hypothetical protein
MMVSIDRRHDRPHDRLAVALMAFHREPHTAMCSVRAKRIRGQVTE